MAFVKRLWEQRPWHHFLLKSSSSYDNAPGLQDVIDSGSAVLLPPGQFKFATRLEGKDFMKLRGACQANFPRANYNKDYTRQTILEFSGSIGAGTVAVNLSAAAPGVSGSDFSDSGDGLTDDLRDVVCENITIDAGDADVGVNIYRAGNGGRIGNVCVINAKKRAGVINGVYSARFGPLWSYLNGGSGWSAGENYWPLSGSNPGDWTINSCIFDFLYGARNGLDLTFNETTAELDGFGVLFCGHRGNKATLAGEVNDGYGVILSCNDSSGPNDMQITYVESNMQAAKSGGRTITASKGFSTFIIYSSSGLNQTVDLGFHNSGFGDNIKIESRVAGTPTADSGPLDPRERLLIKNTGWGVDIQSNTIRYRAERVQPATYSNKEPEQAQHIAASCILVSGATPSIRRTYNCTVARNNASQYTLTFDKAMLDTNYIVFVEATSGANALHPVSVSRATGTCSFVVEDNANVNFDMDANATVLNVLVLGPTAA